MSAGAVDGRLPGFRFDALPLGEYELLIFADDYGRWPLERERVRPPTHYHRVPCPTSDGERASWLRVLDADSGGAVASYLLVHDLGQGAVPTGGLGGGPLLLGERPVPWRLWAAGYEPYFGSPRDFETEEDGRRVAEVALRKGAGAVLHLREGDAAAALRSVILGGASSRRAQHLRGFWALFERWPLAGVPVVSASGLAAVSDAHGTVRLPSLAGVRRLTLLREGWRLKALLPVDAGSRRGNAHHNEYVLWLTSDPWGTGEPAARSDW